MEAERRARSDGAHQRASGEQRGRAGRCAGGNRGGRNRAQNFGGRISAGAEDGSRRTAGGRHRARFQ